MKRAIPYTFLFALFFLFSCGGGGEEYTETEEAEVASDFGVQINPCSVQEEIVTTAS